MIVWKELFWWTVHERSFINEVLQRAETFRNDGAIILILVIRIGMKNLSKRKFQDGIWQQKLLEREKGR